MSLSIRNEAKTIGFLRASHSADPRMASANVPNTGIILLIELNVFYDLNSIVTARGTIRYQQISPSNRS
jgi:hypothetical protein